MAEYTISSGETNSGTILENNSMTVLEGGSANNITVNTQGYLHVYGGMANAAVVNDGGILSGKNKTIGDEDAPENISLTINNGTFTKIVYGGDRLSSNMSIIARYGSITTTIVNGTFQSNLACGMAYTPSGENQGMVILRGNDKDHGGAVNLTIQGGSYAKWVYGGCITTLKTKGAQTHIYGDVSVTLDSSARTISMLSLAVGSHGDGFIYGNTYLTLTGLGSNLTFDDEGEIWGGSTGDYFYTEGGVRKYHTSVLKNASSEDPGTKTLSFTGFSGELQCGKIRAFDVLECDGASQVEIRNTVNFSDVKNWSFEYGTVGTGTSGLSGGFKNDFTGDTLTLDLTGFSSGSWTVISGGVENTFKNFDKLASVTLGGEVASNSDNPAIWVSTSYQLSIKDNSMILSLA